ncbi:MAG: hypothetical protein KDC38_11565, partial [Planctomycetes bacterium]|nr:hypothetical protein [Planctomycetota bacterium]
MNPLDRRRFLQLGAAGLVLTPTIPFLRNPIFRRALYAGSCDLLPSKKMLVIWQRGGNDGVNTIIPYGDSVYSDTTRPTLFIPEAQAIDLNGFCAMHPALAPLSEIRAAGDLAIFHRVGYGGQSRSHFSSQQYWETGEPGNLGNETGWVNNIISNDATLIGHPFPAASVSPQYQMLFQGPRVLSHISLLGEYTLGSDPEDVKLIGALPGMASGSGLLGIYSQPANPQLFNGAIKETGLAMASGLDHLV